MPNILRYNNETSSCNIFCIIVYVFINLIIIVTNKHNGVYIAIGFSGGSVILVQCYYYMNSNNTSRISNESLIDMDNSNISINIPIIPDYTRLYIQTIHSPLHKQDFCCAICLGDETDDGIIKTLLCNHTYHQECIEEWFEKEQSCPLCRTDLDEKKEC